MLSPGATFVLKSLPGFLIPVLGLKALFFTLRNNHDVLLPSVVTCLAYIALNPLLFLLRVVLTSWRHERDAARMGAVQVPVLRGRSPGNYDVVKQLAYAWDNGYVGKPLFHILTASMELTVFGKPNHFGQSSKGSETYSVYGSSGVINYSRQSLPTLR